MSDLAERVISENFIPLKKDLQDDVIIGCKKLLRTDEYEHLMKIKNEEEQILEFLETLKRKNYDQIQVFVEFLQKDYKWLTDGLEKSISDCKHADSLFSIQSMGGIPNLPPINVTRSDLIQDVINKLKTLKKGHYLVLYGMVGCGKTSLAVEALTNSELLLKDFKGKIYWLTVGSQGAADPLSLQTELNACLSEPVQPLSTEPHFAAIELKKRFIEKNWTDCLIVLDDVTTESVLDFFNIGAKVLITTHDKGIISNKRKSISEFIKVQEGFTLDETLNLFSEALEVPIENLPIQATDIHNYTKGHPLCLSLIVSRFEEYKEDLIKNTDRWNYYIDKVFEKGKKKRRRSMTDLEIFYGAIEESVNSLEDDRKDQFQQLAIFMENVNIQPQVLATLWSDDDKMNKFEAEDIMLEFVRKSLAVKKWNELQKCYVYGLHDLVVRFLKKDLTTEKEKELNIGFVNNYKKLCNNVWSKLPRDDNYIFYFIGYHLKKAGLNDDFPRVFFDLEFLEAKLQVTGPGDLIRDYKKYKDLISPTDELFNKYTDYTYFIEHFGVWIHQGIDILQVAFQMPPKSFVYHDAENLAQKRTQFTYLKCKQLPFPIIEKIVPQTLVIKDEICAVSFGEKTNQVIVASGKAGARTTLELYDFKSKSVKRRFTGHKGDINYLDLSPCKTMFLSASMDNTIRVWSITFSEPSSGDRTPSPRDCQENYIDFFETGISGERAISTMDHSQSVLFGKYSKTGNHIGSVDVIGTITLWKNYEKQWEKNLKAKSLDFCHNDGYIVAISQTHVYFLKSDSGILVKEINRISQENLDNTLVAIRTLTFVVLNVVKMSRKSHSEDNKALKWLDEMAHLLQGQSSPMEKEEHKETGDTRKEGFALLSEKGIGVYLFSEATTVYQKPFDMDFSAQSPISQISTVGAHIAATTNDGSLFVWHSETGANIKYLDRKVKSFCVCESALLVGYDDCRIFLYPLNANPYTMTCLKWSTTKEPALAINNSLEKCVQVFVGGESLPTWRTEVADLEKIDISDDGEALVTASNCGTVELHRRDSDRSVIITRQTPPKILSLLTKSSNKKCVIVGYNDETLMWREELPEPIQLKDSSFSHSTLVQAHIIEFTTHSLVLTAHPNAIRFWTTKGEFVSDIPGLGTYCISLKEKIIAVAVIEGILLIRFNENGVIEQQKHIIDSKNVQILTFSPSGKKLAIVKEDSESYIIQIFDCETENFHPVDVEKTFKKGIPLLVGVSDSGSICYGGNGVVIVKSLDGTTTSAVFDPSSIVADPYNDNVFAIIDKIGVICKIEVATLDVDT